MPKTKEELETLRQECLTLGTKLKELSQDELEEVYGGIDPKDRDIAMAFQNYALYPNMPKSDDGNSLTVDCGPNCQSDPNTCTFALNGHFCPLIPSVNGFDKPKTYFVPED